MDSAAHGLAEKNAAEAAYDLSFIISPGCDRYPNGVIEMAHVTADRWDSYAQCNHPSGSIKYSCSTSNAFAGRDGSRYSFPAKGENVHWWETGTVRKSVGD